MKLRWTSAASRDLEEIAAYIGQDNPLAALQTVLQLIDQVRNFKDHPGLGRPGRVQRARELMISDTPYIVHYKVPERLTNLTLPDIEIKTKKTGFWRFVHPLKRRWYLVWVTQDLFGEQVLVLRWGSLDRKVGGGKCEPFDAKRLKTILKRRQRRGYVIEERDENPC